MIKIHKIIEELREIINTRTEIFKVIDGII